MVSRREQATHSGGWGFCSGLGTTLRGGMRTNSESQPANGSSTNIRVIASIASSHISRFFARSTRKPPSSAAEEDSPVPKSTRPSQTRSRVATRSATRAGWLTPGRQLHDPVAQADVLRALGGGRQEDLGRRGVRVLLQEVVLDLPDVVDAHPVGDLDLVEGVLEQLVLVALALPRTGVLMLVEDAEAHGGTEGRDDRTGGPHRAQAAQEPAFASRYPVGDATTSAPRRTERVDGPDPWTVSAI